MFQSPATVFSTSSPAPEAVIPRGAAFASEPGLRGLHAQTLAHAARRRRAASVAVSGVDGAYWKAGVPSALAKAASLRGEPRFRRLP